MRPLEGLKALSPILKPVVAARDAVLGVLRLATSTIGVVWRHPAATPVRWALKPIKFVFTKIITGDWVPSGPWMMVWMVLGFASSIQDYKKLTKLTMQFLLHKEGAGCNLCDTVIGLMLKFDENSPEDIECSELCPFNIRSCMSVCNLLVTALAESSRYPCVSVGMCPDLDEFGQLPKCELKMPLRCEPSNMCYMKPAFPRPKCELLPGFANWEKWKNIVSQNVGALASAVAARPFCGEAGAHPQFCVTKSQGIGYVFETTTYALIFVAFISSIHALETVTEDDDKQWLTFWIITFCLSVLERLTDVILSRYDDIYYGTKCVFVVWLIVYRGADKMYNRFRYLFTQLAVLLDWLDLAIPQIKFFKSDVSTQSQSPADDELQRVSKLGGGQRRVSQAIRSVVLSTNLLRPSRTPSNTILDGSSPTARDGAPLKP